MGLRRELQLFDHDESVGSIIGIACFTVLAAVLGGRSAVPQPEHIQFLSSYCRKESFQLSSVGAAMVGVDL